METTQNVKEQLNYLKSLSHEISIHLNQNRLAEAQEKIAEYLTYSTDTEIYSLQATWHYQNGEYDKTLNILLEGLQKFPYNFEINFNLGIIYEALGRPEEGLRYLAFAVKISRNQEEKEECIESIKKITAQIIRSPQNNEKINEVKKILSSVDAREFPLDQNRESMIRNVMNKGTSDEYMLNMYKSFQVSNIANDTRLYFKTEMFKGTTVVGEAEIDIKTPSMIPLSLIAAQTKVDFWINNRQYSFSEKVLHINKYHYIRLDETGTLKITANKNIFVGTPIPLEDKSKAPKLVLKVFIDGLSYKFLEQHGLENIMPNTYAFFKKGFTAANCYATSEWTLPSKASINTGKYSYKHKMLHPSSCVSIEKYNKLMAEYFKESGLFTANINNNWRTTPTFGYYKGFDRIVYQNMLGGMDCKQVITEAIEHLEAFHMKNNYLSISLMDLHCVPDEIEDNLYSQMNTDILYRLGNKNQGETSVQTKYDENKIVKYYEEIKRLDIFLGILYDFITKKYVDEDIVVLMHSDHGQTFLERDNSILHDSRRKIPLMLRGRDVPEMMSHELIEAVDILPILMKLCGNEIPTDIDGKLPYCFGGVEERKYAMTQLIHPGQKYQVAISDDQHIFQFETTDNVLNDMTVSLEQFNTVLLNKNSKVDETAMYREKSDLFERVVFENSKDLLRWNK
ncbi:sulfatase-like hydrolase/transferase [Paenibacillus sepulcri]|uniref:Sulfatase-like hydrolase/transferase n=1 Tax=Paenibacillus sepulcri TaxID=359917 RepID=A0ABS7BV28_9BACL|nr:sulfatase-like hydrolase/transferase [Paenibacillus sepulcri]